MAEQKEDNDIFIDADEQIGTEKDSYENIILRHMNECVKVLSREMTGGQIIHKAGATGTEKYIEDVNELVINHVDTLMMLLASYMKKQKENKERIDKLLKEIEEYKNEMGERIIFVKGKGKIKLKEVKGIQVDSDHWKEFVHFKAHKYREIFGVLVNIYNNYREEMHALEYE